MPAWHADFKSRGVDIQQKVYSDTYAPREWTVSRIIDHPTGYSEIHIKRDGQTLVQFNNKMSDWVLSYDEYVAEKLQPMREQLIRSNEIDNDRIKSEKAAKDAAALKDAKAVLANDLSMTPEIREANMASTFYATKVRHAASVVNSANKAAAKASKSTKAPSKSTKNELIDAAVRQFSTKTYKF